MPHASSFFSKVAAGYQSDGGEKTKRQRKKLKKRAPFGYSETNYVSYDLSNLMGNHHSIVDDVPRPTRPPRPCSTDLPDLPGLPIYKTFANGLLKPATTLSDEPPPPPPFREEQQQPSVSATAWVLAQSELTSPIRASSSRPRTLDNRPDVPQRPPPYDRASRLAESYQSLLPDFDLLEYPESHTALQRSTSTRGSGSNREQWHHKHNGQNSGRISPPSQSQIHTLRHTSPPRPVTAAAAPVPGSWSWQQQQPASASSGFDMMAAGYPPRASAASTRAVAVGALGGASSGDAHSILTDSSATAVESDVSPVESRFSTGSDMLFAAQGARPNGGNLMNNINKVKPEEAHRINKTISNDNLKSANKNNNNNNNTNPFTSLEDNMPNAGSSSASDKDTCTIKAAARRVERNLKPGGPGRITSSDYVGLQICSELLTDELLKTFFRRHPTEKHAKASKLQVLLLIEAYEAMLDNCRKELLHVPQALSGTSAGHGEQWEREKEEERGQERERAARRRHIRDAVRILDHWLDSLYVIYDDTFGEEEDQGEHAATELERGDGACERADCRHAEGNGNEQILQDARGGTGDLMGAKDIRALPGVAQVPVPVLPAASTTASGPSRLFRGWNRGLGS